MDSNTPLWPVDLSTPLIGRRRQVLPRPIITQFESKRLRSRRNHLLPIKVFEVSWNFTLDEYADFESFFKATLEHGTLSFVMETLEHHSVRGSVRQYTRELAFLDATYSFTKSDNLVEVQAALEMLSESYVLIDDPFDPMWLRTYPLSAVQETVGFFGGECLSYVFPTNVEQAVGFADGVLLDAIVPESYEEFAPQTVGFQDGALVSMDTSAEQEDAEVLVAAFVSGLLFDTVLSASKSDAGFLTAGFTSGVLTVIAFSPGTKADTASMTAGFASGVLT